MARFLPALSRAGLQPGRFFIVLLVGPCLAHFVARQGGREPARSQPEAAPVVGG